MKILLINAFILASCCLAKSQVNPEKGSQRIVVSNTMSASENYKSIQGILIENGFSIDKKDSDNFTVKTQPTKTKKRDISYFLNFVARDNEIIVSGMFNSGVNISFGPVTSVDDYEPIVYRGMKGSLYMVVFDQMKNEAMKFGVINRYL